MLHLYNSLGILNNLIILLDVKTVVKGYTVLIDKIHKYISASACRRLFVRMTMPHIWAVFAAISGVIAIMLHSSIHKIEEGHLAVYYRYHAG